jgi:hypothetical protein
MSLPTTNQNGSFTSDSNGSSSVVGVVIDNTHDSISSTDETMSLNCTPDGHVCLFNNEPVRDEEPKQSTTQLETSVHPPLNLIDYPGARPSQRPLRRMKKFQVNAWFMAK